MRRNARKSRQGDAADGPGHDSFLDVVTNIVGIMIILVMVAGLRMKEHSSEAPAAPSIDRATIDRLLLEEATAKVEIEGLQSRLQASRDATMSARRERATTANQLELLDRQIEAARVEMDAANKARIDLVQAIAVAEQELIDLRQRQQAFQVATRQSIEIKSLPTPLSSVVTGDEAHYQILGGRVIHIPLNDLIELFRRRAEDQARRFGNRSQLTDSVGPIGGFRMRYVLEKRSLSGEFGIGGSVIRLARWRLIPLTRSMGESQEVALRDGSDFMLSLRQYVPGRATITIWTYPDSFREFRSIKEALYQLGYDTAARPLPDGVAIMGSPEGTRSAAQ